MSWTEAPGELTATVNCTVISCPKSDGSGASLVIRVVVFAALTACGSGSEALPAKLASPA